MNSAPWRWRVTRSALPASSMKGHSSQIYAEDGFRRLDQAAPAARFQLLDPQACQHPFELEHDSPGTIVNGDSEHGFFLAGPSTAEAMPVHGTRLPGSSAREICESWGREGAANGRQTPGGANRRVKAPIRGRRFATLRALPGAGVVEFLHLPLERGALDPQPRGGAIRPAHHPAGFAKHVHDVLPFGVGECDGLRRIRGTGFRSPRGDLLLADF
jgi:hypothetical protein